MFRVVTRHNINLSSAELVQILASVANEPTVGDQVRWFEDEVAQYQGVRFAVAFSSGRAALYAILNAMALPHGTEVVVPAYSFFTIPDVVRTAGLVPVFAPCHPRNYALDPDRLEGFLSERTGAVIVEHPFGQPAPMAEILEQTSRRHIPVIEDASQSIGATLNGRKVGSFGQAACMSLVSGKNLTTFGGGVALTRDADLYARLLAHAVRAPDLRPGEVRRTVARGLAEWAMATRPGFLAVPFAFFYALNLLGRARLDALFEERRLHFDPRSLRRLSNAQAALGRLQLARMDARNAKRRANAREILEGLRDVEGLVLPETVEGAVGTWNALAVRLADARRVQRELFVRGVDTRADYMTVFEGEQDWRSNGEVFYLPTHPAMNRKDLAHVVASVRAVVLRSLGAGRGSLETRAPSLGRSRA